MIIQIGILDIISKGSKSYLIQTFNSDINVGDTLIFKSHRFKVLSKDKYGFKAFKVFSPMRMPPFLRTIEKHGMSV